jgi:hypothetical protein
MDSYAFVLVWDELMGRPRDWQAAVNSRIYEGGGFGGQKL